MRRRGRDHGRGPAFDAAGDCRAHGVADCAPLAGPHLRAERTSSHWRDDAKPFSRVASFQGTPVHKDSAVIAPTAQSANRIYAIADSFLAPAIAFQNTWTPKTAACFQSPSATVQPRW